MCPIIIRFIFSAYFLMKSSHTMFSSIDIYVMIDGLVEEQGGSQARLVHLQSSGTTRCASAIPPFRSWQTLAPTPAIELRCFDSFATNTRNVHNRPIILQTEGRELWEWRPAYTITPFPSSDLSMQRQETDLQCAVTFNHYAYERGTRIPIGYLISRASAECPHPPSKCKL